MEKEGRWEELIASLIEGAATAGTVRRAAALLPARGGGLREPAAGPREGVHHAAGGVRRGLRQRGRGPRAGAAGRLPGQVPGADQRLRGPAARGGRRRPEGGPVPGAGPLAPEPGGRRGRRTPSWPRPPRWTRDRWPPCAPDRSSCRATEDWKKLAEHLTRSVTTLRRQADRVALLLEAAAAAPPQARGPAGGGRPLRPGAGARSRLRPGPRGAGGDHLGGRELGEGAAAAGAAGGQPGPVAASTGRAPTSGRRWPPCAPATRPGRAATPPRCRRWIRARSPSCATGWTSRSPAAGGRTCAPWPSGCRRGPTWTCPTPSRPSCAPGWARRCSRPARSSRRGASWSRPSPWIPPTGARASCWPTCWARLGDAAAALEHKKVLVDGVGSHRRPLHDAGRHGPRPSGTSWATRSAALTAFEEARALKPSERSILHEMLELYTELQAVAAGVGDPADAWPRTRCRPSGPATWWPPANILHYELGDSDAAVELYERALDDDPGDLKTFERLDKILTGRQDFKEQARAYRRMIKRIGAHDRSRQAARPCCCCGGGWPRSTAPGCRTSRRPSPRWRSASSWIPTPDRAARRWPSCTRRAGPTAAGRRSSSAPAVREERGRRRRMVRQLKALRAIYAEAGLWDRVYNVCAALTVLQAADEEELGFYERGAVAPLALARRRADRGDLAEGHLRPGRGAAAVAAVLVRGAGGGAGPGPGGRRRSGSRTATASTRAAIPRAWRACSSSGRGC